MPMRSTLVVLPFQDPSTPQLGVALLAAALAEQGLTHAVVDANLDFLHYVETGAWGDTAGPTAPFLPAQARNADEYLTGYRSQQELLLRLSSRFSCYRFAPYQMEFNGRWPDLTQVKADALAPDSLWSRWLADGKLVERILEHDPHWVGLSVNFDGQLPAAMALGRRLKQAADVCVVWGGGLLNAFSHLLGPTTPIWDCADGVSLGAGEAAAVSMAPKGGTIRPAHAALLPRGGWIARAPALETARSPRFAPFPLAQYRSAARVLPYRVFASCHWGKCAFCADQRYRAHHDRLNGDAGRITADVLALAMCNGANGIHFLDAELPAPFMLEMAKALRLAGSHLRWGGNSRLAKELMAPGNAEILYQGGCRFLRFGLESASPAVLRAMQKGTTPTMASQILHSIAQAGIGVHVYLMQGFPGEKNADVKTTVDFLMRNTAAIDSFNISTFQLYEEAPMVAATPQTAIRRTGNQAFWSHPELGNTNAAIVDQKETELIFYKAKQTTRCFPTIADSIILNDTFQMSYTMQRQETTYAEFHSPTRHTGQQSRHPQAGY